MKTQEQDWGQEEMSWQKMRRLDCITNSMDMRWRNLWEMVKNREASCPAVHDIAKRLDMTEWTTTKKLSAHEIYLRICKRYSWEDIRKNLYLEAVLSKKWTGRIYNITGNLYAKTPVYSITTSFDNVLSVNLFLISCFYFSSDAFVTTLKSLHDYNYFFITFTSHVRMRNNLPNFFPFALISSLPLYSIQVI